MTGTGRDPAQWRHGQWLDDRHRYRTGGVGRFGTNYIQRAQVALTGIGANLAEDASIPTRMALT